MYPFVAPDAISGATVGLLARAVGSIAAFDCSFRRTAWFAEQVLWLAPEPDGPFRALTAAVLRSLPVAARISRGWLMIGGATGGSWHQIATLPLGAAG